MMSKLFTTLFVISRIVSSIVSIDGTADLYVFGSDSDDVIIDCDNGNCKHDSTSGTFLQVIFFGTELIVNCPDQDSCTGGHINCGVIPDSAMITNTTGLDATGPITCTINCGGETSCKELSVAAAGDATIIVNAGGKSSFEGGSIACGIDALTSCAFICSKEVPDACKEVMCSPSTNCMCEATGTTDSDIIACPTVEPTKEPTASPVTATPTKSPVVETQNPTSSPTASPPTASTSPTQAPTTPYPTESPVTSTLSPTNTPTASPPTASTSPTQAPTTPFPTTSPVIETDSPTTPPTASPPTASTSPTQAPTTPYPTASPVTSTLPPTNTPTATPPTASTSPTLAPTTPIPTQSPVTSTLPPTGSPTATPPPPPLCTIACEGETGPSCTFEGESNKIFVCTNQFESCTASCTTENQCQGMEFYSGAPSTTADCTGESSCSSAKIFVGSGIDVSKCDNVVASDFVGPKSDSTLNCGDSACKDLIYEATGSFTGSVTANCMGESGLNGATFTCDIPDDTGSCTTSCGTFPNGCKDYNFECLALSSQCSCTGECEEISELGTPACPPNAAKCVITGEAGKRYVITSDVKEAIVDCVDSDEQCTRIIVYSAAEKTIVNAGAVDALKESTFYLGEAPVPIGFEKSDFEFPDMISAHFFADAKTALKDVLIKAFGSIDVEIYAMGEQAAEGLILDCDIDVGKSCNKTCVEFEQSCVDSITVCPNVGSICECMDIEHETKNSSNSVEPQSSCTPSVLKMPHIARNKVVVSNNELNKLTNKSESRTIYAVMGASAGIIFICALIVWCNYNAKYISRHYYKINDDTTVQSLRPKSKNNNNDIYNTFEVEMQSETA